MGIFPIGDQRVGIELAAEVTGYTEYNEPIYGDPIIVWVDNACFEIQTPTEQQNMTVTTSEIAWAFLPVADGVVPAVDDDNDPAPVLFFTDGKPTINSGLKLRHNGMVYVMRGDAVLEQDIHGREDHVFCVCEREQG